MRVEAVLKIALFEVQTIWMFVLHALMLLPFCPVSEILIHQPMSELFFVYFMVEPFLKHHYLCHYPAIFFTCSNSSTNFHYYKKNEWEMKTIKNLTI